MTMANLKDLSLSALVGVALCCSLGDATREQSTREVVRGKSAREGEKGVRLCTRAWKTKDGYGGNGWERNKPGRVLKHWTTLHSRTLFTILSPQPSASLG